MAVRYRDTKTKQFVSKATWARSKAHGGTRYKRESFEPKEERKKHKPEEEPTVEKPRRKRKKPEPPEEPIDFGFEGEDEEEEEWTGAFDTP